MVSVIIYNDITATKQEHSIGSDLEKTTLCNTYMTQARLYSDYEFIYKISSHTHLVNSRVSLLSGFNLHYNQVLWIIFCLPQWTQQLVSIVVVQVSTYTRSFDILRNKISILQFYRLRIILHYYVSIILFYQQHIKHHVFSLSEVD